MNIAEAARKYADYTIEMRRYFHKYPELSLQEENTAKKIREELTKMGIPFVTMANYGTVATIGGKNWRWRVRAEALNPTVSSMLGEITKTYMRG